MTLTGLNRELQKLAGTCRRSLEEIRFRRGALLCSRYRIERRLGGGSYGVAYLCRDLHTLEPCVLKRISPVRGGRRRTEAIYAAERDALRMLGHPAIPKLLDTFRHGSQPVIVMTHMPGETLEKLLFGDGRVFTEREALRIVLQLLPLLAHMHARGLYHRDIGIANVLLDGNDVRLIDFGLSRRAGDGDNAAFEGSDGGDRESDEPIEKRLRRRLHPSGDLYGLGHLLLFLLYSGYRGGSDGDRGWEEELSLHPRTTKLLRRLLQAEQPYGSSGEAAADAAAILPFLETD